jgi:hypothetical protein
LAGCADILARFWARLWRLHGTYLSLCADSRPVCLSQRHAVRVISSWLKRLESWLAFSHIVSSPLCYSSDQAGGLVQKVVVRLSTSYSGVVLLRLQNSRINLWVVIGLPVYGLEGEMGRKGLQACTNDLQCMPGLPGDIGSGVIWRKGPDLRCFSVRVIIHRGWLAVLRVRTCCQVS